MREAGDVPPERALEGFSGPARAWFAAAFEQPTAAQRQAWQSVWAGDHTLVVAPTGSGKTLAAFLAAVDEIATSDPPSDPQHRCRVVYVSPLKALASDVERNLRAPLVGIGQEAQRAGVQFHPPTVAIRSGDTTAGQRRDFARGSADILITTPESLFLLLTSKAGEQLAGVRTIILDEVHAIAGTKRGAHLAVTLERLDAQLEAPAQRIGLSATVRPVERVASFLAGARGARPVRVVAPAAQKQLEVRVEVPVPDLAELAASDDGGLPAAASIWPHVEERVVDLVAPTPAGHSSSLVFTNSRRLAERLTARLNEEWQSRLERLEDEETGSDETGGDRSGREDEARENMVVRPPADLLGASGVATGAPTVLARAHHGSVSKEQRQLIEEDLKSGRLPAVVATSSLELGIDMGAVDLVVQVETPPSVSSALQRIGRAGHQVGAVSRGVVFPKFRADLVTSAVVVERMRSGRIEEIRIPANPLDVLAQQIVAMVAMRDWTVTELAELLRRSAPFSSVSMPVLESVLDMLSGRYPSEDFAELRPRIVWDRVSGVLSARAGAQRLAVTSGGTIPDRGLFGVFLAGGETTDARGGRRVGELDEEMVYESRVGDCFTLGASTWQIVDITHDQVLVVPAPGRPGRLPFWHGDQPGRPYELGQAVGAFLREIGAVDAATARQRLTEAGLDAWAADNLLAYLDEQARTGRIPDDRTIVIERFRDELGDWRVVIHSPFGRTVHAPWALAISAVMRAEHGVDVQAMAADDGIVLRLPDTDLDVGDADPGAGLTAAVLVPAEEIVERVTQELGGSALFASRFRECAARALLLPRRRPDRRSPLWQQRQRSAQLLEVAANYPSFPIVLEAVRECLSDVFDVPALQSLLADLASGRVRVIEISGEQPSAFARSLLFGYVAQFLYEGDSPLAERRAAALALDPELLAELLGTTDTAQLADLLDPEVVHSTHRELQRLAESRQARSPDEVSDLLRLLGPLSAVELRERCRQPDSAADWAASLVDARRAIRVRIGGQPMLAAAEDAGRLRDALGTALPVGLPVAFTEVVDDPLTELVARHSRWRVGFTPEHLAARWGVGVAPVRQSAEKLRSAGRLAYGQLLPAQNRGLLVARPPEATSAEDLAAEASADGPQYCHQEVLRLLRRRSLAALRAEVEPVAQRELARFVPAWQQLTRPLRGLDGVVRAVEQLAGLALPASAWETLVLPARVADYSPGLLDELTSSGELIWAGHARLATDDGWVSLHLADSATLTMRLPEPAPEQRPVHDAVLGLLRPGGGFFFRQIVEAVLAQVRADEASIAEAVWDLVWEGKLTGDTFAPLRALVGTGRSTHRAARSVPRARYGRRPRLAAVQQAQLRAAQVSRIATDSRMAGRWSALESPDPDPTARAALEAEILLDRYGVLTRGSVMAEEAPGGFARPYRVLTQLEEAGRVRRGYFVEGLGASQFATAPAVDRLRAGTPDSRTLVLAACDPANVFGAALPWPAARGEGHRPARRAGALVVIRDGELLVYAERGARTLLTFTDDAAALEVAAQALAEVVRTGRLSGLTITTVDGQPLLGSPHPIQEALRNNGFHTTPKGMRLRR